MLAAVTHQSAGLDELAIGRHGGYRVLQRECGDAFVAAVEESVGTNHKPTRLQLLQPGEDLLKFIICARGQQVKMQAEPLRGCREVIARGSQ